MLPDKPFADLPHPFKLKPLLITGKAMEYYGLGTATTSDFLLPKPEFERLCEAIPEGRFTTVHDEKGVRFGTYAFYVSLLGFSYYDLEVEAVEEREYFVLHFEVLLFFNTLTLIHEPENQNARHHVLFLLEKLGVCVPVLNSQGEENDPALYTPSDGRFEDVQELTLTELPPYMGLLLTQHGCDIMEKTREDILITLPAKTQQQLMWPRTIVDRYRIVLSDGLELRYEIDRLQKRSLLDVVLQNQQPL